MKELESRFVFVDTSMYQSKNFQFYQHALGRFTDLCQDNAINLLMSPVVEQEVRSHLIAQGTEAARNIKDFKKEIKILRNLTDLPQYAIFAELTKETINDSLIENFENFLSDAVYEDVSVNEASLESIVSSYFNKVAPFSDKKKSEFPDAIILDSLLAWAKKNRTEVYVLSTDKDMADFCEGSAGWLIHCNDLDGFIGDVIFTEEKLKDLSAFALEQYEVVKDELENLLEEQLESIEYTSSDFDLDNEISEIETSALAIESINVIKADREYAEFSLKLTFDVEAWHSFSDYDRSIWDSEDKKYILVAQSSRRIRNTVECNGYVTIEYEEGLSANTILDNVEIEDSYIELDPNAGIELDFVEHDLFAD
ncbi:DUF4935 domain-containing protein [Vibrio parahaemolyticus]|nr:DUF4935 domain-containing protein [Vibrio parahaemolyticus]MDF4995359.1 PIN domain-containing protein [Vibrio parahaemolyticus]